MDLQHEQRGEDEVAPVFPRGEVAGEADEGEEKGRAPVDGTAGYLQPAHEVVPVAGAVLPLQQFRPEALVGEAFDRVREGVLGCFEGDEVGFCGGDVEGGVGEDFVRVVQRC